MNVSRMNDYLDSICPGNSAITEEIRKQAVQEKIPIIRRETEQLLKTLLVIRNPKRILEVGTAVGYSSVVMHETIPAADITTMEIGKVDYEKALKNFEKSGTGDSVKCIFGDATEILPDLIKENNKYDFVFMDAAKAQYVKWLPLIKDLLNDGGILFSDNVLQDNTVLESRFAIDRRERTIHSRLREYIYELMHDECFTTSLVPIGDGVTISCYQGRKS